MAAETALIAALTMLTPLVDGAEWIDAGSGRPLTRFGLLFPLYLLHVVGYLTATIVLIVRSRKRVPTARKQLTLIGIGICATAGIAFITNAVLPYIFGNFRFCDA